MDTNADPARRSREHFGVRGLVRAFGRRLVAVECGKTCEAPGPLDAALLWRQVGKAAKAVTSHRTPNGGRRRARANCVSGAPHRARSGAPHLRRALPYLVSRATRTAPPVMPASSPRRLATISMPFAVPGRACLRAS